MKKEDIKLKIKELEKQKNWCGIQSSSSDYYTPLDKRADELQEEINKLDAQLKKYETFK